jgi:hypothetical protein
MAGTPHAGAQPSTSQRVSRGGRFSGVHWWPDLGVHRGLTTAHRTWGFGLCFLYLRNVKQFTWNHKRVYRVYRALELNLRINPRKRLVCVL